jgi:anti-sigma regulatory factor (Ser/Thr protein kinase)
LQEPLILDIQEESGVGEARRQVARIAGTLGLSESESSRLAIIVTELGTNMIKHGGGGSILIGSTHAVGGAGAEVLAIDSGRGIADIARAFEDGYSTAGSPGTGLGAVRRQADFLQLFSAPGKGATLLARVGGSRTGPEKVGGISIPMRGESVDGDGWGVHQNGSVIRLMVVDGLGHGQTAADAAQQARNAFHDGAADVVAAVEAIHGALRGTRGAAVAVAEVDPEREILSYCGVGNISTTIVTPEARRSTVSMHGIAGHNVRELRLFTYPCPAGALVVMHSDGVSTRWDLAEYPGLVGKDPALIAAVLWKTYRRESDDSTVVVARCE